MIVEYKPRLNIIHVTLILIIASCILLYLIFIGWFVQIIFLLGIIATLFISLPFYFDLKFDENTIIHHNKKYKILSYVETEGTIQESSWGRISLFYNRNRKLEKFLRISTVNNTYYIYEINCNNYNLIKEILRKNDIEANSNYLNKRQKEINKLNRLHLLILIVLVFFAFCAIILSAF